MTGLNEPRVCVVIAAWGAAATIARAVTSALDQAEVSEVLVIDDASPDGTGAAAWAADDGTRRLRILRQSSNQGPSAARNRALAESRADYIAILDADDFLLPGRFRALLAPPCCDAIADDIAFIPEAQVAQFDGRAIRRGTHDRVTLTLSDFVAGNIARRGRPRGELGFLKPLLRRSFLVRHGLRYDETLRLGEDFVLYAQMLAAGARFDVADRCGYVAVERSTSLSGRHETADLAALLVADEALLALPGVDDETKSVLHRHRAQLAANWRHRHFLDMRRSAGLARATAGVASSPLALVSIAWRIVRDKMPRHAPKEVSGDLRYLLEHLSRP